MPEWRRQLDEARRRTRRVQRLYDAARFARGIQPVGVERHQAESRLRAPEGVGEQAAMLFGQIEIVHRAGDVEVGVGVEPVDEADPLMAQIAFDLEIGIEAEALGVARLQPSPEFLGQPGFRQIGDVRRHPRHREARGGRILAFIIVAAAPFGIGHDRLAPDLVEGDVLRRMARRARDDDG